MERACQNEEKQPLLPGEDHEVGGDQRGRGEPPPPDGGWGWIVVLACFLTTFTLDGKNFIFQKMTIINFGVSGIGYSFGMFMEPLKSELGEGNFGVASVGSIQVGFTLSCLCI